MSKELYNYDDNTGSWIAKDFKCGKNFKHGLNVIIEPDVIVGDDVTIGHFTHLKSGTRMYNNVNFADHCFTTGICIVGNNVNVRSGSCVSKSVIVNDWVFIGAGIMSSHTKNVFHGRPNMKKEQHITRFGYGSVIGSSSNFMAGIQVAPGAIVGYSSSVVKNLDEPHGVYFNNQHPFATLQTKLEPSHPWYIEIPEDYKEHEFEPELLKKYLPHCKQQ